MRKKNKCLAKISPLEMDATHKIGRNFGLKGVKLIMANGSFEKGIITFSFDDGRKDTYHVLKDILAPRKLPGVVYIPSGYIDSRFNDPTEIGYNGLMSKSELDEIVANDLFEIGAHGYMHKNDFEDLEKGLNKLREWYPKKERFGLASPHSEITKSIAIRNAEKYKEIGFSYVRGGRNFEKMTTIKRAVSLIARKTKLPFVFKLCYMNSVNRGAGYYLNAIPIHKLTTLEQVKAIVDYVAKVKCWAILGFHGLDKRDSQEYTEEFCWAEDDFIKLCDYIQDSISKNLIEVRNPIEQVMIKN